MPPPQEVAAHLRRLPQVLREGMRPRQEEVRRGRRGGPGEARALGLEEGDRHGEGGVRRVRRGPQEGGRGGPGIHLLGVPKGGDALEVDDIQARRVGGRLGLQEGPTPGPAPEEEEEGGEGLRLLRKLRFQGGQAVRRLPPLHPRQPRALRLAVRLPRGPAEVEVRRLRHEERQDEGDHNGQAEEGLVSRRRVLLRAAQGSPRARGLRQGVPRPPDRQRPVLLVPGADRVGPGHRGGDLRRLLLPSILLDREGLRRGHERGDKGNRPQGGVGRRLEGGGDRAHRAQDERQEEPEPRVDDAGGGLLRGLRGGCLPGHRPGPRRMGPEIAISPGNCNSPLRRGAKKSQVGPGFSCINPEAVLR